MRHFWRTALVFLVEVGFIAWKLGPHWKASLEEDRRQHPRSTPPMDNEVWGEKRQSRGGYTSYSSDEWE